MSLVFSILSPYAGDLERFITSQNSTISISSFYSVLLSSNIYNYITNSTVIFISSLILFSYIHTKRDDVIRPFLIWSISCFVSYIYTVIFLVNQNSLAFFDYYIFNEIIQDLSDGITYSIFLYAFSNYIRISVNSIKNSVAKNMNVIFTGAVTAATIANLAILVLDRSNQFKTVLYDKFISSTLDINIKGHKVCTDMGSTIRAISRGVVVDPEDIENIWSDFISSGDSFNLLSTNDSSVALGVLQSGLLALRLDFLKWKHERHKENYDEADSHATNVELSCAVSIGKFLSSVQEIEGIVRLSTETSDRFKDKTYNTFRGGGDGGG